MSDRRIPPQIPPEQPWQPASTPIGQPARAGFLGNRLAQSERSEVGGAAQLMQLGPIVESKERSLKELRQDFKSNPSAGVATPLLQILENPEISVDVVKRTADILEFVATCRQTLVAKQVLFNRVDEALQAFVDSRNIAALKQAFVKIAEEAEKEPQAIMPPSPKECSPGRKISGDAQSLSALQEEPKSFVPAQPRIDLTGQLGDSPISPRTEKLRDLYRMLRFRNGKDFGVLEKLFDEDKITAATQASLEDAIKTIAMGGEEDEALRETALSILEALLDLCKKDECDKNALANLIKSTVPSDREWRFSYTPKQKKDALELLSKVLRKKITELAEGEVRGASRKSNRLSRAISIFIKPSDGSK